MATQGLVTVKSGEKVLMKVIAGCDGQNAKKLAKKLKKKWPVSAREAYDIAMRVGFGDETCLVAMTDSDVFSKDNEDLDSLY